MSLSLRSLISYDRERITTGKMLTRSKTTCQFRLPYFTQERYECPHEIVENDNGEPFCLFHIKKTTVEEKNQMSEDELQKVNRLEFRFSNYFVHFMRKAHTSNGQFIDCRGFCFPETNIREGVAFHKRVDFTRASFEKLSFFASTMSVGDQDVSAKGIHFYETANFTEALFKGFAGFILVAFHKGATFTEATFQDRAIFERTRFGDTTSFDDASFKNEADFEKAIFSKSAFFRKTSFQNGANFLQSQFEGGADFTSAIFGAATDFSLARLANEIDFSKVQFGEDTKFNSTIIPDKISFERASLADNFRFSPFCLPDAKFTSLTLPRTGNVTFEKVDLSRASFLDTNLELITFRDVKWARPASRFGVLFRGSRCLYDELRPATDLSRSVAATRDYEKIAENYRQLVLNYERKRDYDSAEDFHVGEMEMRRKKKGNRATFRYNASNSDKFRNKSRILNEWANSYNLYRILSNYGTSYWQALIILVALIFTFSIAFLFAGFEPIRADTGAPRIIEYNLFPDSAHRRASAGKIAVDFRESLLFTLSIITFQKERFYEPVGSQARLCLYFAVLFLTAQAALVLLALRRRFKR